MKNEGDACIDDIDDNIYLFFQEHYLDDVMVFFASKQTCQGTLHCKQPLIRAV